MPKRSDCANEALGEETVEWSNKKKQKKAKNWKNNWKENKKIKTEK